MAENENERLVMLSDGVIAVAITLLALEIRIPGEVVEMADGELWVGLLSIWPRLFAYALSFWVIAIYWLGHRAKFEAIRRRSPVIDRLNFAFLLTVCLMPFASSVLAESGNAVATAMYAGLVVIASLVTGAMSAYALSAGLVDDPGPVRRALASSIASFAVFGLSIPLAFLDINWAKLFWILLWPASILATRLAARPAHAR